jgi:hypothetical protein
MAGDLSLKRLEFPWKNAGDEFQSSMKEEWSSLKAFWQKTADKGEPEISPATVPEGHPLVQLPSVTTSHHTCKHHHVQEWDFNLICY